MKRRPHHFLSRGMQIRDSKVPGKFPLEDLRLVYCGRLLGRMELSRSMLSFVFCSLPRIDRISALRYARRLVAASLGKPVAGLPPISEPIEGMDPDEMACETGRCLSLSKRNDLSGRLERYLEVRIQKARAGLLQTEPQTICGRMADLQRLFGLADDELALVAVVLCYSLVPSFEGICDSVGVQEKRELAGILTGMPVERLAAVTGRKGRLIRAGILDMPENWSDNNFYRLAAGIRDHLIGMGDESLALKFAMPAGGTRYAPEQFGLPEDAVRIVTGLLRATTPCSIMVHGVPGTGKTEFAKAVAAACGKKAYFVEHAAAEDLRSGRVAVEAVTAAYQADKFIVVVDEADELLNLQGSSFGAFSGRNKDSMSGKSWLNDFLDRCQAQVIWITNEVDAIEESTMRRFAYNVPFRRQSARRRQEIWMDHLQVSPLRQLVTVEDVAEMARKFRVGAAGIANALQNAVRIVPPATMDKDVVLGTLRELLTSHERMTGGGSDEKLAGLASQYDPGAVCTDVPADGIVAGLKSCASRRKAERPAANLLFWGPPGTGKTAFAQYLAQSLDKELLIRRASDLLSMYVGGTEHNIRNAFDQASHEDAILLLDEADSFFIDRTRAQRSWETSQTNELLTQMENHHGILICCTNLLDSLDHAVLRRFAWKVRFQAPTAEGRQRIYRRYFDTPENPVPVDSLARVARLEHLTPGDMKAVWVRFRFRPASEWNHTEIVQALTEEVAYRGQKGIVAGFQAT